MKMDSADKFNIAVYSIIGFLVLIAALNSCGASECAKDGCSRSCVSGSSYCNIHQNTDKGRGTETSNGSSGKGNSSSGSNGRSNVRSNNNSSNGYNPDVDEYDSYDEFMEDWDGNMPDGSDAEDYWGDW